MEIKMKTKYKIIASLAAATLLVVGLGIAGASGEPPTPPHVYTVDPVVQLAQDSAENPAEFKGYCTGFYIGNRLVVSAGHCVQGDIDKPVTMLFSKTDGTVEKTTGRVVMFGDPTATYDFSVIRLTTDVDAKGMELNCSPNLSVGTTVSMTGYPLGGVETTVEGKISTKPFKLPFALWVRSLVGVNIAGVGGFSGSPVSDVSGRVVGILVGGFPPQPSLSLIEPVNDLCKITEVLGG